MLGVTFYCYTECHYSECRGAVSALGQDGPKCFLNYLII
jgi:hypothetical protein